jgi:glycosyltransferase involved in cell wall biosynthesis
VIECEELGITGNVTINRGFVSEDVLLSLIRTVKLCVLPYANHPEHDVRAASGAARMIIPTTTPLIVSGVHLFDDLEGVVPRVRDDFELYQEIDNIFSNYEKCSTEQISKRKEFLRNTSWENVASLLAAYYRSLV